MCFSVGQRERAAPRTAKHEPLLDTKMLAYVFDVLDEMPGRVVVERSVRKTSARAALVKKNYAIGCRIKEAPVIRIQTCAWPTVEKHDRLSVWIAALLVIKLVNV